MQGMCWKNVLYFCKRTAHMYECAGSAQSWFFELPISFKRCAEKVAEILQGLCWLYAENEFSTLSVTQIFLLSHFLTRVVTSVIQARVVISVVYRWQIKTISCKLPSRLRPHTSWVCAHNLHPRRKCHILYIILRNVWYIKYCWTGLNGKDPNIVTNCFFGSFPCVGGCK